MRRSYPLLLAIAALLAADPAAAQIAAEDAAQRIREACKLEQGTDPAKCDCYVDELETILPAETYEPMVVLAAAVMSGDRELMQEFIADSDIDSGQFNEMVLEMQQALGTAEQRCEGGD